MTKPISNSLTRSAWAHRRAGIVMFGALTLAGCSGSLVESLTPRLGGATYAGDIQPTVARAPDRDAGTNGITASQGFDVDAREPAPDPVLAGGQDDPVARPATVTGAPAPTTAPQPASPAPTAPPASQTPASTIASTAAPPATAPAPEPGPVEDQVPSTPVATVATGTPPPEAERPQTFPNLADVPDPPEDLPSQETLDAEREALATGAPPPAPPETAGTSGQTAVSDAGSQSGGSGSLLGSLRERLASQQPSGPSVVYFEPASISMPAGGDIAGIAQRWRDEGGEIRVVGFARILEEGGRSSALGTALQRANAVAAALVASGVSASEISVFANAVEGEEDDRRTRRVDVFLE